MFYFVKVRIDLERLSELGEKLASGELDTSKILHTYCLEHDLAVGMSIWEVKNAAEFKKAFAPLKEFYKEILEVSPVVTAGEAQKKLMEISK